MRNQRTNPAESSGARTITPDLRIPWLERLENRLLFSTYTVTTLGDAVGAITPNGAGKFNASSLRAAITAANAHAGADTINFAASVTGTINLGKALPQIADTLTLTGPGSAKLTVQRSAAAVTDFSIFSLDAGKTMSLLGMKIANGTGTPNANEQTRGGGIFNSGNLAVSKCVISANSAKADPYSWDADGGGGIINFGTLTVTDSTISENSTGSYKGGGMQNNGTLILNHCTLSRNTGSTIENTGSLVVNDSTFSENFSGTIENSGMLDIRRCTFTNNWGSINQSRGVLTMKDSNLSGNGGSGVGIYAGVATITGCTITGSSSGAGGGIYNSGVLTLIDSTLYGNEGLDDERSTGVGGGIYNRGPLTVRSSTIAGNVAGGIYNVGAAMTLTNCIVAGNASGDVANLDFSYSGDIDQPDIPPGTIGSSSSHNVVGTVAWGGIISGGWYSYVSLVYEASLTNLVNGKNGNRLGVTASQLKLGPLASNGGPTQTMALLPGSIAINAGSNAKALDADGKPLTTDQRGTGFARLVGGTVDVGAFEVQSSVVTSKGSVAGVVFKDLNGNRIQDAGEAGLKGWLVWADLNKDGRLNYNEPRTVTNSAGRYTLTNVPAGYQLLRLEKRTGWQQTTPRGGGAHGPTILTGKLLTGWHFGLKPILG
ncbi:choice-of-anchor Q domain-containing protein [Humisphaera borealis]|uniref:SD-repeat containing protein B domain-containing protein n=1 Tax=Humisphaera borealis TaxID=2807512 RepID=A0A7M2WQ10_9BACT|nr:choice-of-anchor Q domain-containing protein [Humisphaera borealis]QOV87607.1 hypothetical protein IPV69_15065 [Humisphaera borealis]